MIPLDVPDGPAFYRGYYRNQAGHPLIKHPKTLKSDLAYDGASNWYPFDTYDGVSTVYADRGSWCHQLCEMLEAEQTITFDFQQQGVDLGIDLDTQYAIGCRYIEFLQAHNLTAVATEATAVCDTHKVATMIDRVDLLHSPIEHIPAGSLVVTDIKTSSKVDKAAYAVQLQLMTGMAPYDVETGVRGEWPGELRTDVAFVHHLPLTAVLKGDTPCEWSLWMVTLDGANRQVNDT